MPLEEEKWYAMNAFRGGAISIEKKLTTSEIVTFVPKEYKTAIVKGNKPKQQLLAVIPSLIFIKGTFSQLDEICNSSNNLHFRYTKIYGDNKNVPITIPNGEMVRFISFVDGNEEHIDYITNTDNYNLEEGESVIITQGPFAGKKATFVKVANKAKRQIVIEIENILGATVKCTFPSRIIEQIKS